MHWPLDIKQGTLFNGLPVDCPPGGKALIFDLDHRNGQVLNLVMGKRHDLGMAELPESVTKEDKNNSEHSFIDSQIHFAINGQCFLECFFHTPSSC